MKVKFQADADLEQSIVNMVIRREPPISFRTASSAGFAGLSDQQVLALAAQDKRILVSHDQTTMPTHFAQFISSNTSYGLIIIPQRSSINLAVKKLIMIWTTSEAELWINRISYISA